LKFCQDIELGLSITNEVLCGSTVTTNPKLLRTRAARLMLSPIGLFSSAKYRRISILLTFITCKGDRHRSEAIVPAKSDQYTFS
jgi:hypothetical protein